MVSYKSFSRVQFSRPLFDLTDSREVFHGSGRFHVLKRDGCSERFNFVETGKLINLKRM